MRAGGPAYVKLGQFIATAERLHGAARSANLSGFVELFAQLALEELDFRLEAANLVDSSAVLEALGAEHMPAPGHLLARRLRHRRPARRRAAGGTRPVPRRLGRQRRGRSDRRDAGPSVPSTPTPTSRPSCSSQDILLALLADPQTRLAEVLGVPVGA